MYFHICLLYLPKQHIIQYIVVHFYIPFLCYNVQKYIRTVSQYLGSMVAPTHHHFVVQSIEIKPRANGSNMLDPTFQNVGSNMLEPFVQPIQVVGSNNVSPVARNLRVNVNLSPGLITLWPPITSLGVISCSVYIRTS